MVDQLVEISGYKKAIVTVAEGDAIDLFKEQLKVQLFKLQEDKVMSIRTYKPTSPSRRAMTNSTFQEITCTTQKKKKKD